MSHRELILQTLQAAGVNAQAVYLFGSHARGDARADSDVDVAVLVERELDPVRRWEIQEQLASVLHTDVDLIDLRAASTVLRVQVLRDGVILLDAAPNARAEFEMYALSDYGRLQEERRAILEDAKQPGWLDG